MKTFGSFGLEVRKKRGVLERTFAEALHHAHSSGLLTAIVIDVAAAHGMFMIKYHSIFPKSRYMLVEPLKEYERYL